MSAVFVMIIIKMRSKKSKIAQNHWLFFPRTIWQFFIYLSFIMFQIQFVKKHDSDCISWWILSYWASLNPVNFSDTFIIFLTLGYTFYHWRLDRLTLSSSLLDIRRCTLREWSITLYSTDTTSRLWFPIVTERHTRTVLPLNSVHVKFWFVFCSYSDVSDIQRVHLATIINLDVRNQVSDFFGHP